MSTRVSALMRLEADPQMRTILDGIYEDGKGDGYAKRLAARKELERLDARILRLAQALRLLRDTSGEYTYNVCQRALDEAGIPEPPDEDHP